MDRFLKELKDMDALASTNLNYGKTLALLRAMKAGEVDIDQVTMLDDGWQIMPVEQPQPPSDEPVVDVPAPAEPSVPEEATE